MTSAVDLPHSSPSPETPFPSGTAVTGLVFGFAFTRLLVGASSRWPWLGTLGTFSAVVGVFLALAALSRLSWESSASAPMRALRLALVVPLFALDARAMFGDPSRALQSIALGGVAALLTVSLCRGATQAYRQKNFLPAVTLVLLLVGELIELVTPPLRFAAAPTASTATLATRLGNLSEITAFIGIPLALFWTVRSALRRVGFARTLSASAMPIAFGVMIFALPFSRPLLSRTAASAGFNVRFDLAGGAILTHPSAITVAFYSTLFSFLLAASTLALSLKATDSGSLGRRALGWACILTTGFGAVSTAGPVDPLRLTTLCLGALLLEQSVAREDTVTVTDTTD